MKYPGFRTDLSEKEFGALVEGAARKQCDLALELRRTAPDDERVPRLMLGRWTLLVNTFSDTAAVLAETAPAVQGDGPLAAKAALARALAGMRDPDVPVDERFRMVKDAAKCNPDEKEWGASLLAELAIEHVANPEKQREICELAAERFPGSWGENRARTHLRLLDRVGETLELEFTDALTGEPAGLSHHRGRRTVVHVWWVNDRPEARAEAKELRALRDAGTKVISVPASSIKDEALVATARELGMDWPHALEEARKEPMEGWAWKLGLRATPVYLLVDEKGRLAAVAERLAPLRRALADG